SFLAARLRRADGGGRVRRDHGVAPEVARRRQRAGSRGGDADRARPSSAGEFSERENAMTITIAEAIQRTVEHREVFHDEMLHIMRQIMGGELTPAQVAGFMIGLRVKKETIGEIAAAAQVMREFATKVPVKDPAEVIDVVGTGGDAAHTFNVSTTA